MTDLSIIRCERCGKRLFDMDSENIKLALSKERAYNGDESIIEIICYQSHEGKKCKHKNKITLNKL